jgi:hypothetical protein
MAKRSRIQQRKLNEIEGEFRTLLLTCLRECAHGRYGLFGQNDHIDPEGRYWNWPEARRLKELAHEIKSLRLDFGQPNENCERYLQLCSLRGSNVPGEPRLAALLLDEIDQG